MILRMLLRPPSISPAKPGSTRSRWLPLRFLLAWLRWIILRVLLIMLLLVTIFGIFNPPTTWTIIADSRSYPIEPRDWADIEEIAPVMRRSVVAAEDANFCLHWGFDMIEIRKVVASGSSHGASTISQQTAKNVFLWQNRSWTRKVLEAIYTPMVEAMWSKQRILEVYLNVAEFGPGVFGVTAASRKYFGTTPDQLTPIQAARLAAVLPAPKSRNVNEASRRSRAIADGAATIARDGRADCL